MAVSALSTDARVDRCFPSKTWEALVLADDDVTPKLVNDTAADLCPRPICSPPTVALIENTINQNCLTSEEEKADCIFR
ncbi:hypothetical protein BGX23_001434 [Mortierella sp. AD031]|nr:hypothetical protein BGX23_001434 [Mortierella sp. AD031]